MNVTDYTHLINKPDAITEKQTEALGNVLNEFPYFQSARALRLKGLYNQNSFKYNYALKVTAAHTTDRSVLFDFITSDTFVSIQNEYYDQKLKDLLNITVFESEIVVPEIPKVPEIRIDPIEQSILSSIREATTVVFEEQKKPVEKPVDVVTEQPVLTPVKEETPIVIEETIAIQEITLDSFVETVTPSVKEEDPIVVEEPIVVKEVTIDSFVEQPVATSAEEEMPIVTEEPVIVEEITIDSFVEQPVSTTVAEETLVVTEEPIIIEEITIDSFVEQPVSTTVAEETPVVTEEPVIIEEITIDSFVEQPVSTAVEKESPIVVEETEKTTEVRVEPIEASVYNSIKQATTVVFEDLKEAETSETVKNAEENLEIGKPLDFSVNEKHSFHEWLQLARTEPIDRTKEGPAEKTETVKEAEKTPEPLTQPVAEAEETISIEEEKKKKAEIINKFIETNPKIPPIKPTAIVPTVMLDPNKNEDNSYLMTETLARVYLEQKKYTKAIQAYEILILKYPEKISFFADRISDIKILQQNNNNN
ncbi:hypothetical protein GJU43_19240 [Flavobacterium sp. LC2016-23]|uniref:tetratricopeptide repeat protein n=1 Tax=Flavobacterium sp. LC2016-23 TaxID=2666330 RepID=UPI0012B0CA5C|nr:tetratricopeptide repeat protein [Flavobacterium sp. LC2016-23]MRX41426.1 hypothetical protein [Flavobacterium sp. LC2016-23]